MLPLVRTWCSPRPRPAPPTRFKLQTGTLSALSTRVATRRTSPSCARRRTRWSRRPVGCDRLALLIASARASASKVGYRPRRRTRSSRSSPACCAACGARLGAFPPRRPRVSAVTTSTSMPSPPASSPVAEAGGMLAAIMLLRRRAARSPSTTSVGLLFGNAETGQRQVGVVAKDAIDDAHLAVHPARYAAVDAVAYLSQQIDVLSWSSKWLAGSGFFRGRYPLLKLVEHLFESRRLSERSRAAWLRTSPDGALEHLPRVAGRRPGFHLVNRSVIHHRRAGRPEQGGANSSLAGALHVQTTSKVENARQVARLHGWRCGERRHSSRWGQVFVGQARRRDRR